MQLRFREDRRTLLWAFLLLPGNAWLGLTWPALAPYLVPVALYGAYVAGVLAHNHNHCPTFANARSNRAYSAWLSIFYGLPIFVWIPTHNQNHHRYENGDGDVARTELHAPEDSLGAWLRYPLVSGACQLTLIRIYLRDVARKDPRKARLFLQQLAAIGLAHAGFLALAASWHGARGLLAYGLLCGLPALLAPYLMMLTNYQQHVGCDPHSRYDYCRNFVSPFWNFFVFDNGFHTVHHEWPGVHWSRYRRLHAVIEGRIEKALNQPDILTHLVSRYFASPSARGQAGPSDSSLGCRGNPLTKPML